MADVLARFAAACAAGSIRVIDLTHTLMHGAGRYGLQCLRGLDRLPATGALLVAAPLKIAAGSGSPLRVLALVPG